MMICLLSKEINDCPFCDKEKMKCNNELTQCAFQRKEVQDNGTKYVRKERWYEKYYKNSKPIRR